MVRPVLAPSGPLLASHGHRPSSPSARRHAHTSGAQFTPHIRHGTSAPSSAATRRTPDPGTRTSQSNRARATHSSSARSTIPTGYTANSSQTCLAVGAKQLAAGWTSHTVSNAPWQR
ncbi:unnamed protein product [Protopolystoma xenopodis]|uniref:Uncharacterized protein n=1 Tax=Protopolystoma xenopodis TaxID=117903 RepID=A0A3S5AVQ6_9PLAT|nr:unnamed protein product [Protopolystoma xenopodis]